ncbi:hypothetical protein DFH27DRAFT_568961 [Peziza echinospora]|nr:hypothetical protein DFH27DRAFT_568961 [Peziza echinospora]
MPSTKRTGPGARPASSSPEPEKASEPIPKSGFPWIPQHILNPLILVILNLTISSGLTALAAQYIGDELSIVQKNIPEEYWWYVVPGWRVVKALGIWYGGFGATETTLLTMLSLAPTTHFLATFHPSLSAAAHASTLSISTLSITLPIYLLRSRAAKNHHHRHHRDHTAPNTDKSLNLAIGLLTSSIYASVLYTALKTFLTRLIVTYFSVVSTRAEVLVESVERVYHPTPASWGISAPVGFAVAQLIFEYAVNEPGEVKEKADDDVSPAPKSFVKKIWDWFSPRGKTVIKRTGWVAGYMGADTLVKLAGVMRGGSLEGAAAVSGVWVAATFLVGGVYGWIGRE